MSASYFSDNYISGIYPLGTCRSCSAQGKNCGIASDQCGGYIYCGACASGQVCSEAGQCVAQGVCTAGEVSGCKVCKTDGLGWADDSSKCADGKKCSLGQCVSIPSDSDCTAKTCSSAGYECGAWNDACGGIFDCGACAAGKSCSAAGKCVDGAGTPQTDIKINGDDGPVSAKPNTLITLSWISNNTTACTASGNWSGSKALSGYESIVMSSENMVFSISCTGDSGTVSDSITVNAAAFGISLAESIEVSSGATADLNAKITGTAPSSPVYQWSCTGGSLSDSSILAPVYTAPAVTSNEQYVCTLTVRDGNSAGISKKININVKTVPQNVAELEKQIAEIKALIAALQKQLAALAGLPATESSTGNAKYSCAQLTKYLIYNTQNDPEVKCLQEFLIAQGFSGVAAIGNYDAATRDAVKTFQEKYAAEILAPYGLTYGSGNVGNDTRRKINALIAAGQ
ncbi:MAG TPA: peptidoglycan-binding protein [Candidatus Pacearchaeota archaeon]|nr:peptidoglycan-binding protein [Candidatus Pacearchaeota archaeon]